MTRTVSVVIPTKDSSTLVDCIDSICAAKAAPAEVIVVDSSSSKLELPARITRIPHFIVVRQPATQLAAKRIGVLQSSADLILFLDSDQQLDPLVIPQLMESSQPMIVVQEVVSGSGVLASLMNAHRKFLQARFFEYPDLRIPVIPRAFARECLVRAFAELERKHPNLGGLPHLHEDSLLLQQVIDANHLAMTEIDFVRDPIRHVPIDWHALVSKAYAYGRDKGLQVSRKDICGEAQTPAEARLLDSLDFLRWRPYFGIGVNLAGLIYDGIRVLPMFAGYLRGRSTYAA